MTTATTLATLAGIVVVGSYLQTLTGFAFGLVFMSAAAATGVIGIEESVTIVSLLVLVNAALVLGPEWRYVSLPAYMQIIPLALLGTVVGSLLLPILVAESIVWLKFSLGVVVIASSLRLLRIPSASDGKSSGLLLPSCGLAAGLMSGLFAVPGPPLVYAIHRQMSDQRSIRATLVALFTSMSTVRLITMWLAARPTLSLLATTALLVPVVMATTTIARRWPPPLSPDGAKLVTVILLVLTGGALCWPAIARAG